MNSKLPRNNPGFFRVSKLSVLLRFLFRLQDFLASESLLFLLCSNSVWSPLQQEPYSTAWTSRQYRTWTIYHQESGVWVLVKWVTPHELMITWTTGGMFREQWDGTEIGTAAAVFPRLKTLSLEICSYEGTNPELSLVSHMQSPKAEEIKGKKLKNHIASAEKGM